jgi:hypothetical protein
MSDSAFENKELTLLIITALVKKLGGTVTLKQSDINDVSFTQLIETYDDDEVALTFKVGTKQ